MMDDIKMKPLGALQIKELQQIYEHEVPYASHVNSLFLTYFKWKRSHPERDDLNFYGLDDDWKKSGTFLLLFRQFDIFMFTLDKTGEDLLALLNDSKCLKIASDTWNNPVIYGIRNEHLPPIHECLRCHKVPIKAIFDNKLFYLPKEEALKFEIICPDEVYIDKLNVSYIDLLCSLWPYSFPGVEEYLSCFIEMNHGYGVFLKENRRLVSWVLQDYWGVLIVLETVPEFKRKGYGSLIVKKMCVEVAKEGINPMCTIVNKNHISKGLFLKLGFQCIGDCTYLCL
ncbi:uncharacterized protein [Onthophagus taurus]|uniref:uncharacterized protein n=1 Tax=Onthophagus taurus TaxID=166361 RepID=UPI0039BE3FCE